MELFIVDAFTNQIFGGNQAGVVLLGENEKFPDAPVMQKVAAELKHSETAFVKAADPRTFRFRYFTPEGEVNLCGHATVSAFTVLRNEKRLDTGNYIADTPAGSLHVTVEPDRIWLQMAQGKLLKYLTAEESAEVFGPMGLICWIRRKACGPVSSAPGCRISYCRSAAGKNLTAQSRTGAKLSGFRKSIGWSAFTCIAVSCPRILRLTAGILPLCMELTKKPRPERQTAR